MPVLPNIQHEQFAQAIAQGVARNDAARLAGYNAQQPGNTALYLCGRDDVRNRILELQRENGSKKDILPAEPDEPSRPWIVSKYMTAVRLSEQREDRANMIKALDSIAKLEGYMIDRVETRTGPLDQMSAADLQMMIEFAQAAQKAITVQAKVKVEEPKVEPKAKPEEGAA